MDIGPGDWVRYSRTVDIPAPILDDDGDSLFLGEVYQVENVIDAKFFLDGIAAVELCGFMEMTERGFRACWDIRCFDPIGGVAVGLLSMRKEPA